MSDDKTKIDQSGSKSSDVANNGIDASTSRPGSNRTLWIVLGVVGLAICCAVVIVIAVVVGLGLFVTEARGGPSVPDVLFEEPEASSGDPVGEIIAVPTLELYHIDPSETFDYNSDPPSSGPHYPQAVGSGFYEEVIEDGYLVHSLEHGYVIIWYDCDPLTASECEALMNQIIEVMITSGETKLIGMPRPGMEHTLALTSWGRIMFLDEFDEEAILNFIEVNINQSPEPDAP